MPYICPTCKEFVMNDPHHCSGKALPLLRNCTHGNASVVGTRVEIDLSLRHTSGMIEPLKLNMSHKKHLFDSWRYENEGYQPTVPQNQMNTICRVPLDTFMRKFEAYAGFICASLIAHDPALFVPNDPNNVFDAGDGIFFHSDVPHIGLDMHCYPVLPPGGISNVTFALSGQEFGDLLKLLRFLYHRGERDYTPANKLFAGGLSEVRSKQGDAEAAFNRSRLLGWFTRLFTEHERTTFKMKLGQANKDLTADQTKRVGQMINRPKF